MTTHEHTLKTRKRRVCGIKKYKRKTKKREKKKESVF
jgi:hypothetical protein